MGYVDTCHVGALNRLIDEIERLEPGFYEKELPSSRKRQRAVLKRKVGYLYHEINWTYVKDGKEEKKN